MAINQKETETGYLNVLRVYACVAVIIFHVFSPIISFYGSSLTELEKYICVILHKIWLWHVPSFVMITGVIFLNKEKEISISRLFKKYVFRIVLALIIFGLPFAFMEIFFDANYEFNVNQIGMAILNVFQGKLWDHMWYLYMLIGLYMLLPLFKIFANNADRKILEYVLIVLFIFTSILPTLQGIIPYKFGIYIPINSVFVFYLLLGHYVHKYNVSIKNRYLFIMGILYVLYIALMPLNKKFINANDSTIIGLYGYISPFVVMITFCIFCYLKQNVYTNKAYDYVSKQTFGMYLIHALFLNILFKFLKITPEKYPLIMVIICAAMVTIIFSLLFSMAIRKIKIVEKYIL